MFDGIVCLLDPYSLAGCNSLPFAHVVLGSSSSRGCAMCQYSLNGPPSNPAIRDVSVWVEFSWGSKGSTNDFFARSQEYQPFPFHYSGRRAMVLSIRALGSTTCVFTIRSAPWFDVSNSFGNFSMPGISPWNFGATSCSTMSPRFGFRIPKSVLRGKLNHNNPRNVAAMASPTTV